MIPFLPFGFSCIALCLCWILPLCASAQTPLFAADGAATNYDALLAAVQRSDVVLFGELHTDSLCHALELRLLQDAHVFWGNKLVVAAEMLEADQQMVLDEYLSQLITEKNFQGALQLWKNYAADYAPLVNFARQKGLPFVAANIPRRYASMVFRGGFEALNGLSKAAKRHIAPLPIAFDPDLPNYRAMLDMGNGMGGDHQPNLNFPRAQAIKDATMAHFIVRNWRRGKCILHFNGAYHSNNREGIVWYLRRYKPQLRILTISTVQQAQQDTLDENNRQLADFILVTPLQEEE